MPNWKKLIVSGSDAVLNSIKVTEGNVKVSSPSAGVDTAPLVLTDTNSAAVTSKGILFGTTATGIDQPIMLQLTGSNAKGIVFHASSQEISITPDGASFLMYNNSSTTFPGQIFFDGGATNESAIIWRTAPTNGTITERMRVTAQGNVGIGTVDPTSKLDISGSLRVVGDILQNNDVTSYTNPVYTNALINFYGAEQNYNGGGNLAFDGSGLGAIVSSKQNSIVVSGNALGNLGWDLAALPLSFTTATMQDNVNSISLSSNQITFPIEFNNSTYDSRADQTTIYYSTPVAPAYYISTVDHGTVVLSSSLFLPNLTSQQNTNIVSVDGTGKLYKSNPLAGGSSGQIQYNASGLLGGTSGLAWNPGGPFLTNTGYYVMDFALNSGGGFFGRGAGNNLMQMGFNCQGRYGGISGQLSGNQFFVYNFYDQSGDVNNKYYWGFNNDGDCYYGPTNSAYSVRIQQPRPSTVPLTILGRSDQTANLFQVSKDGEATGAIMMVSSSGNIGMGTTTPTQKLDVSGSVKISDVLVLPYQNPLPTGKPTGSIATSGSGATFNGLYLYNGTAWIKLSV